eukprot:8011575-Lingulodinium_polyedra.AAC.1
MLGSATEGRGTLKWLRDTHAQQSFTAVANSFTGPHASVASYGLLNDPAYLLRASLRRERIGTFAK